MTDRERLIGLLVAGMFKFSEKGIVDNTAFADFLLENGVIIPPCKVGDTVYCINTFFESEPRINECEVDALHITSGKNLRGHKTPSYALVRSKNMRSLSSRIYFEKFGITAFLTREEAKKTRAEMVESE